MYLKISNAYWNRVIFEIIMLSTVHPVSHLIKVRLDRILQSQQKKQFKMSLIIFARITLFCATRMHGDGTNNSTKKIMQKNNAKKKEKEKKRKSNEQTNANLFAKVLNV